LPILYPQKFKMPPHWIIAPTQPDHIPGIVALQRACFPEPFPAELLWQPGQIESHLKLFAPGQFVAIQGDKVIASCTNMLTTGETWNQHLPWDEVTGGLNLPNHIPTGQILYGIDISVHPKHRSQGIARALYQQRFQLVKILNLQAYGTVCRLPDFADSPFKEPIAYADAVATSQISDRTLTPLLKIGLTYQGVITNYMHDEESGNAGAILTWQP
jgi:GNAT superfamily N-acetyltransferase